MKCCIVDLVDTDGVQNLLKTLLLAQYFSTINVTFEVKTTMQ